MVTVIALLLGLAVVALQLSSTQFSPRLLRNFLRDRPNQVVLSAFVATFAYSAAGLYTVGVSGGNRTAAFPRLAVSGAIVLLFASLGLLVFFADGLGAVIIPGRRFREYLAVMCGLIRRYGASEPTVAHALLRLLSSCAAVAADDPEHCAAIEEQARIIVSDAEREVPQPAGAG